MVPVELELEDFLTFRTLKYKFPSSPVRVQGDNRTDDFQKSNGAGKSTIQTAIEFAYTATNSRGVRDAELVNYDAKQAKIRLLTRCDQRRESLLIEWTIKRVGSNLLSLSIQKFDEEEFIPVSFSNVNDGKKWISTWLAIEKEDLFNYYLINKERFKSFFKSSDRENIELINRFSDTSILDGVENLEIEEQETELAILQEALVKTQTRVEEVTTQIDEEKSRDLQEEKEEKVEELQDKIDKSKEEVLYLTSKIKESKDKKKEYQKTLEDAEEKVSQIQKELDAFKPTDFTSKVDVLDESKSSIQEDLTECIDKKSKSKVELKKIKDAIDLLESRLRGAVTCPGCSLEFNPNKEEVDVKKTRLNLTKAEKLELEKEEEETSYTRAVKSCKDSLDIVEDKLREISNEESKERIVLRKIKTRLEDSEENAKSITLRTSRLNISIEDSEDSIESYEENIKDLKTQIKGVKVEKNSLRIKELSERLDSLKLDIKDLQHEISGQSDKIYEMNQWKDNFKRFKMFIANKSLKSIEFHCNRFLSDMRSDIRIKIDGFKELADGRIKESISPKVIRGEERSFGSLSGGEKGRVLFASILANKFMIDSAHPYGGFDYLSIDEVFEGVDSVGLKYLMKAIKDFNFPVMIITHVSEEDTRTGDVLTIIKENGESRIE